MSEFATFIENEIERQNLTGKVMAARMGIDASVISQFINQTRSSCRPDTLMKMILGISSDPAVQAKLLEAYFRDQCTEQFKSWIHVEPEPKGRPSLKAQRTVEAEGIYGNPISDHASKLRELRLPNDIIRALTDIASAIPGRHKFRIVIEDLGTFAREDLLAPPPAEKK